MFLTNALFALRFGVSSQKKRKQKLPESFFDALRVSVLRGFSVFIVQILQSIQIFITALITVSDHWQICIFSAGEQTSAADVMAHKYDAENIQKISSS